jgi:hypothetical protein
MKKSLFLLLALTMMASVLPLNAQTNNETEIFAPLSAGFMQRQATTLSACHEKIPHIQKPGFHPWKQNHRETG